jgi:hypothetical protein
MGMKRTDGMKLQDVIDLLVESYCGVIRNGLDIGILPPPMLWGSPGLGKSQAVRQIGAHIEQETGKKVVVTDVRLILFNPIDLRGIPTANSDKTLAVWLKPAIFDMDERNDVINILLLDEISAAPQSVQAAAYQITLDRKIGEHKLPENCIVIAAGNRVTDKSVAYKMPKALANRLCHFDIGVDFRSWKNWAIKHGLNEKVIGFLSFKPDRLMCFDAAVDELAFATPRSWEMVSNVLNSVSAPPETLFPYIVGCIGEGVATEFITWLDVYKELPDIGDIFAGRVGPVPVLTDTLYALVSSMVTHARGLRDDEDAIENSIVYGTKLPVDFATVLFKDFLEIDPDFKSMVMRSPAFAKWLSSRRRFFDYD